MTDNHPFSVRILPSALPTTAFRAVENHSRLCHESTIHCVSKPPSPSSATLSIVGNSHYRQRPFHFSKPTFHYEGRLPPPYCAGDPHHRRQPSPLFETYRLCEGSLPPPYCAGNPHAILSTTHVPLPPHQTTTRSATSHTGGNFTFHSVYNSPSALSAHRSPFFTAENDCESMHLMRLAQLSPPATYNGVHHRHCHRR